MKEIKLFVDFEFTSLSPDAQPISVGIVSDELTSVPASPINIARKELGENIFAFKSIYCEFSDFDINRCDDWVKENVMKKLTMWNNPEFSKFKENLNWRYAIPDDDNLSLVNGFGDLSGISNNLKVWLDEHFKNYNIQFVCDCGTYDWYWMVQLLAEWEKGYPKDIVSNGTIVLSCSNGFNEKKQKKYFKLEGEDGLENLSVSNYIKNGLPKLPSNISPVSEDLNDLIARVKGISVREAFDLNREELLSDSHFLTIQEGSGIAGIDMPMQKHSAIWDARVIKEIYQKLK